MGDTASTIYCTSSFPPALNETYYNTAKHVSSATNKTRQTLLLYFYSTARFSAGRNDQAVGAENTDVVSTTVRGFIDAGGGAKLAFCAREGREKVES